MAKAKKTEKVAEDIEVQDTADSPTKESPGPQLTVQDLIQLRTCIELGSQRGAWRANELTAVGTIYEKLNAFLTTLLPPKDAEADEPTADKGETKND